METTLEDVVNAMESVEEKLDGLTPKVTVNVPKQPPPNVSVSPQVNITNPPQPPPNITVNAQKVTVWTFNITDRDYNGRIKTFTATPTS